MDFFAKLLQGNLLRLFRDIILGYKHISKLNTIDKKPSSEERIRNDILPGMVITDYMYEREMLSKPVVANKEKIVTWAYVVKKNNNNWMRDFWAHSIVIILIENLFYKQLFLVQICRKDYACIVANLQSEQRISLLDF